MILWSTVWLEFTLLLRKYYICCSYALHKYVIFRKTHNCNFQVENQVIIWQERGLSVEIKHGGGVKMSWQRPWSKGCNASPLNLIQIWNTRSQFHPLGLQALPQPPDKLRKLEIKVWIRTLFCHIFLDNCLIFKIEKFLKPIGSWEFCLSGYKEKPGKTIA